MYSGFLSFTVRQGLLLLLGKLNATEHGSLFAQDVGIDRDLVDLLLILVSSDVVLRTELE